MNDDIVTRLRDNCACGITDEFGFVCASCTAADEIERLRADRDKWAELAKKYAASHRELHGLKKAWDND